jgi:phosphatidylglycerophosphate synthase
MLGQLRSKISKYIENYIGKPIAKTGIHPNHITALSVPLAIIGAYYIYLNDWFLALTFMILSIFIDNVDGAVARVQKTVSNWGSYFDVMMDKHVEMIIYFGFALAGYPILAFLAAVLTMLNSYAKPSVAIRIPIGNADWPALGERADRLIILLVGVLITIYSPILIGYDTIFLTLWAVVIICAIGDIQRMLFAKKLIQNYEKTGKKQMTRK